LSQGKTFADIGFVRNISLRTAKDYLDAAEAKFGVRTAKEAAALFLAGRQGYDL
jgi:DNA-binding CsgD family transcriptional regulator